MLNQTVGRCGSRPDGWTATAATPVKPARSRLEDGEGLSAGPDGQDALAARARWGEGVE